MPVKRAIIRKTQQKMLVRIWGKMNPYTLLVGMEISVDIIEISMEVP
jgi:hypothetical protein